MQDYQDNNNNIFYQPIWMAVSDVSEEQINAISIKLDTFTPEISELERNHLTETFSRIKSEIIMEGVDEETANRHAWVMVTKKVWDEASKHAHKITYDNDEGVSVRKGMRVAEEWIREATSNLFNGGIRRNEPRQLHKIRPMNPYHSVKIAA